MFCCCRPTTHEDDPCKAAGAAGAQSVEQGSNKAAAEAGLVAAARLPTGRRSNSLGSRPGGSPAAASAAGGSSVPGQLPLEPLVKLGEGAALQAAMVQPGLGAPLASAAGDGARGTAGDDALAGQAGGVLKLVGLLQELLALSTASPRQPLSKAMGLLVVRLPVDWACLHAISSSGRVVMQVGAALSPEAQRQRGASGSCSYATPVQNTPGRQRMSYNQHMQVSGSTGGALSVTPSAASAAAGQGVQETGGGHLAVLPGSGSSLEVVAASRQALAVYAGDEGEAARLPRDWQRLHKDRDLRSFLAVPIIASGSSGSIIGALSFGLTTICDWGSAWWMSSIQLLCGWAAGALPQNRATARACFFDALWSAPDLDSLGRVFVHQLPNALVDPQLNKMEVRLALVSSRLAYCLIYASQVDSSSHGQQQQQQQQQRSQRQGQSQGRSSVSPHPSGSGASQAISPASPDVVLPEGVILTACGDNSGQGISTSAASTGTSNQSGSTAAGSGAGVRVSADGQPAAGHDRMNGLGSMPQQQEPVARFSLPTSNSVLLSALEWGEVMVVKDTVTYFGRNAGGSAVRDLFLPDRPMVRGTLVLLPLLYRCRPLGCVYLLAPWDIHAALGKAALQEMAALLAAGTFRALLGGGLLQQQWYSQVLSEGPLPSITAVAEEEAPHSTAVAGEAAEQHDQRFSFPGQTGEAPSGQASSQPAAAEAPGGRKSPALPDAGAIGSSEGPVNMLSSTSLESSLGGAEQRVAEAAATASSAANTSCPLPLSTASAAAEATAAASAAAAAATAVAPVGLAVSGHSCSAFPELVLWPELLDVKDDLARSRHTAVYTAEHASQLLAVKLFRYSSSMDHGHQAQHHAGPGAAGGGGGGGMGGAFGSSSGSSGNVVRETELEAVLSLQYRLCSLQHEHVLQHVAVYPHMYEVVHRRSSREPPDVYLTSVLPRKERHHRCAALVSEYTPGGCLRDAVNRGAVHVPTAAALQAAATAAGLGEVRDLSALSAQQLQQLMTQLEQQLPLLPTVPLRHSHDMTHMSAPLPGAAPLGGLLGQPVSGAAGGCMPPSPAAGLPPKRLSHEQAAEQLREPHMPLLRQLLLHIALGMQHLHANGIVHGELRLDNVMIAGALPPTVNLLLQQQPPPGRPADALQGQQRPPMQQQQQHAALDIIGDDRTGRTNSSSCSVGTVSDLAQASCSSQHCQPPSTSSSAGSSSSTSSSGYVLKLKDIGLCTIGWSHRQVSMRKLAGRPRLQAVSWLAPECFRGDGLSKHSDVYAFGILMWELYTGQVAFNDLVTGSAKVLQTIINDGVRPQFPDSAPSWYVTLASRCWSGTAKNRPSFRRIVAQLQALDKAPQVPQPAAQSQQPQSQQART